MKQPYLDSGGLTVVPRIPKDQRQYQKGRQPPEEIDARPPISAGLSGTVFPTASRYFKIIFFDYPYECRGIKSSPHFVLIQSVMDMKRSFIAINIGRLSRCLSAHRADKNFK
jgi:hypothetical protein